MPIASLLIFFNIAIFVVSFVVLIDAYPFRRLFPVRVLLLLILSFCVVSFCALNVYVLQSFTMKVLFSRLRFVGLSLLGPCWLLFISSVYRRWTWLQRPLVIGILVLPATLTILFTFFPFTRDWVVSDFSPFFAEGLAVVKFSGGAWFGFYILWSYLLLFASFALGLDIFLRERGRKRRQIVILFTGCFIAFATDVYCVAMNSPLRWLMLSGATFFFDELAIVYAAHRHRLLDLAPFAIEKIFQDIPDPVLVTDGGGFLRAFNQAARRLFAFPESPLGLHVAHLLPDLNLDAAEVHWGTEEAGPRFFSLVREELPDAESGAGGYIIFFREITAQKKIEERLNENLEFKARLMALIAHDLSGNMNNQALLSSALQNQVQPEYRSMAGMLTDSSLAARDLMRNLLSWARSQEGRFSPHRRDFEVNTLVADVIESLQTSADLKTLSLRAHSDQRPLIVHGDSEMIGSVLRNLISNAIRASHPGGRIEISIEPQGDRLRIAVRDQGEGMSPAQIERVLNSRGPSFAGKLASAAGYGIGLAIVKHFVELHGGSLKIESSLGSGTEVSFQIPL